LKGTLPSLDAVFENASDVKELYRWAFGFAKDPNQKCMDVEVSDYLEALDLVNGVKLW
jgi:hypothetical protein